MPNFWNYLVFAFIAAVLLSAAPAYGHRSGTRGVRAGPMNVYDTLLELGAAGAQGHSISKYVNTLNLPAQADLVNLFNATNANRTAAHGKFAMNYTVFAFTDLAYAAKALKLDNNTSLLSAVMRYHAINGTLVTNDLNIIPVQFPHSLLVDPQYVQMDGFSQVFRFWKNLHNGSSISSLLPGEDDAALVVTNITCSNGIIHIVDAVMLPPASMMDVAAKRVSSAFLAQLNRSQLLSHIQQPMRTLFAPTAASVSALSLTSDSYLTSYLLRYHIVTIRAYSASVLTHRQLPTDLDIPEHPLLVYRDVANGPLFITDGAQQTVALVITDCLTSNGVIHFISQPLVAPVLPTNTIAQNMAAFPHLAVVTTSPRFSFIYNVLANGFHSQTFFAPSNQALANITSIVRNARSLGGSAKNVSVFDVLRYHVANSSYVVSSIAPPVVLLATMLNNGSAINLAPGQSQVLTVVHDTVLGHWRVSNGRPYSPYADLNVVNVQSADGILYQVDQVVMPPLDLANTVQILSKLNFATLNLTVLLNTYSSQAVAASWNSAGVTIFAPTNGAMQQLGLNCSTAINCQLNSGAALYHSLPKRQLSTDLQDGQTKRTTFSSSLPLYLEYNRSANTLTVENNALQQSVIVTFKDIPVANGVLHIINEVLIPEATNVGMVSQLALLPELSALSNLNLSALASALKDVDDGAWFAPDNQAVVSYLNSAAFRGFTASQKMGMLTQSLLYQLVPQQTITPPSAGSGVQGYQSSLLSNGTTGRRVTLLGFVDKGNWLISNGAANPNAVNTVQVDSAGLPTTQGKIFLTSGVLDVPLDFSDTAPLVNLKNLRHFVEDYNTQTALKSLYEDASGITIFAPIDAVLTAAALGFNGKNTDILKTVLSRHVAQGAFVSSDLKDGMEIRTRTDSDRVLKVAADGDYFTINGARIIQMNLVTTNAVIHLINGVFVKQLPEASTGHHHHRHHKANVGLAIGLSVVVVVIIIGGFMWFKQRREKSITDGHVNAGYQTF